MVFDNLDSSETIDISRAKTNRNFQLVLNEIKRLHEEIDELKSRIGVTPDNENGNNN